MPYAASECYSGYTWMLSESSLAFFSSAAQSCDKSAHYPNVAANQYTSPRETEQMRHLESDGGFWVGRGGRCWHASIGG